MDCQQYEAEITELLDCELDAVRSSNLFLHMGGCERCRSFIGDVLRLRNSLASSSGVAISEYPIQGREPRSFKRGIPMEPFHGPVSQVLRKRFTISVAASVLLISTIIAGSATLSTLFAPPARVIEKKVQQTVYVVQLPQVEVHGFYADHVKSN
jgi:hypothetical protein